MSSSAPVAVFDSGVGGLSVAREIRALLPAENLLYIADSAFCPYGARPTEEVRARSVAIGRYLESRGAKLLVVACNTASGAALEVLREALTIPVVGLEPAVKPAVRTTRNGRVGVLATEGTLRSERFARLVRDYADGVEVVAQPGLGLVELVEEGEFSGERVRATLDPVLRSLREREVDTVVLGCTHYPFLHEALAEALGPEVTLLDSAPAIARQTRRVLEERGLLAEEGAEGWVRMLTTGDPAEEEPVMARLWPEPVRAEGVTVQAPSDQPPS
ncbi:MAG: glutamate racemase [Gemmatimonadetes bacterium]|nr:glutamate racemase [Gemmatimonadota bacterium]